MWLLAVCLLTLLFFSAIFYALRRKRYVRAAFKGPFASFEFEADDQSHNAKKFALVAQDAAGREHAAMKPTGDALQLIFQRAHLNLRFPHVAEPITIDDLAERKKRLAQLERDYHAHFDSPMWRTWGY